MNVYIVRHGETEWNKEEVFRGTKDIPLNAVGKEQAARVGDYFIDKRIGRILSSPLSRARETADAMGRSTKVAIEMIGGFRDMDFGRWEGLTVKEVEKRDPEGIRTWRAYPQRLRVSGGETLSQVRRRAVNALQNILTEGSDNIVIVTHRVLCKILILHFLSIPNHHFWDVKCDPAGISLAAIRNDGYVIGFLNDTCHLQDDKTHREYRDF